MSVSTTTATQESGEASPDQGVGARSGTSTLPDSARRTSRLRSKLGLLLGLPVPIAFMIFWHVGATNGWELPFGIRMSYVPLPWDVVVRLADLVAGGFINDNFSGRIFEHTWASLQRVLNGFFLAAAFAIPLGVLMGRFRLFYKMTEPMVNVVRPIPVTAWAPLSLLIIGFGDRSTIFLIFIAAFFPILINTVSAVQHVPPRLLEAAAMLGTRSVGVLYKVVLPAAAPGILSGLRIGLGLAWVILVVGETVGISVGLGSMITQARDMSKTDLVVAGMVWIGLAGFLADRLLVGLTKLALRGRPVLK